MIEGAVCEGLSRQSGGRPLDRNTARRRIQLFMFAGCMFLLCFAIIGFIEDPPTDWESNAEAAAVMLPVLAVPALLWQDRKNYERRDAALTLPWNVRADRVGPRRRRPFGSLSISAS